MKNINISRRISATLAGTVIAAGVAVGGLAISTPAIAGAQPASSDQCTSMTMTNGRDIAGAPSNMTRAGRIASLGPSTADSTMQINCSPADHG